VKSLADLNALKQKAMEDLKLRESKDSVRIIVGMGTCGIAAGAREVVGSILDELAKRKINDVAVTQTGCIGLCVKEPLVDVIVPGQPKVTYGNVDAANARQIVAQHVVNGLVVGEWVVNKL
jgi:(2Fe-2S) ferredoxin